MVVEEFLIGMLVLYLIGILPAYLTMRRMSRFDPGKIPFTYTYPKIKLAILAFVWPLLGLLFVVGLIGGLFWLLWWPHENALKQRGRSENED
jgi:hypothetical protein